MKAGKILLSPMFVVGFNKRVGDHNDGGHLIFRKDRDQVEDRAKSFMMDDPDMIPQFQFLVKPVRPNIAMVGSFVARRREMEESYFKFQVVSQIIEAGVTELPRGVTRCRNKGAHGETDSYYSCEWKGCVQGHIIRDLKKIIMAAESAGLFEFKFPLEYVWPLKLEVASWPLTNGTLYVIEYDGWDHGKGTTMTEVAADAAPELDKVLALVEIVEQHDLTYLKAVSAEAKEAAKKKREAEKAVEKVAWDQRESTRNLEAELFVQRLKEALE